MFGAGATLWGCDQRQTDDRNRGEVSDEKRRHRYLSITLPPVWNDAAKTEEKLCPMSQQRLGEKWNYSRPTSVEGRDRERAQNNNVRPLASGFDYRYGSTT